MPLDDYGNPEPGDLPDPEPPPPGSPATGGDRRAAIAAAYQQNLGRAPKEDEYAFWMSNDNFASEIANSPEAQAFKASGTVAAPGAFNKYAPIQGFDYDKLRGAKPYDSAEKYSDFARLLSQAIAATGAQAGEAGNQQIAQWMTQHGGGQTYTAAGDKINGLDTVRGMHSGSPSWWLNNQPGSGGAGGGSGDGGSTDGSPTPHGPDDPLVPLPIGEDPEEDWFGLGGGYTTPDRPSWLTGPYVPGTFTAPTEQELFQDPGYKARLDASQQAFERGAAAKGSILSGGSQVALGRRMQTQAADEYQNLYGRKFGEFGAKEGLNFNARSVNENTYQNDVGNSLNQYNTRYKAYQDFINNQFRLSDQGLNATLGGRP